MKKILFIDRDGTIISEPPDEQVDSFDKFQFLPGAITNLARIARELDYQLVLVTNQDGLGTAAFPEDTFWPVQNKMLAILAGEGVRFAEVLIDRSFPADNRPTRKPGIALLTHYLQGAYDLAASFTIGDRATDVELARNLGCQAIRLATIPDPSADFTAAGWAEIYRYLQGQSRIGRVERRTGETAITVEVNLDGSGQSLISTGLGFFDHMLEQLARHGNLDLTVDVKGDLQVDEHHTVEDTALALGQAFDQALGSRKGIERYGFLLPMDDCLAQVAIDFGGRPWLEWTAEFKREKIGDLPTEMFRHFFKSFSDAARCNLNISASGTNEHHKIEAIFKAWARAIRMAVAKTGGNLPSTKGVL
ncbi:MAG: bifunctional histidinol-phosphatase/imidazoleglycerol-phosphate dehydratase HisB [Candidatus Neomarinimicrobiota bacterium]